MLLANLLKELPQCSYIYIHKNPFEKEFKYNKVLLSISNTS